MTNKIIHNSYLNNDKHMYIVHDFSTKLSTNTYNDNQQGGIRVTFNGNLTRLTLQVPFPFSLVHGIWILVTTVTPDIVVRSVMLNHSS